MAGSFSCNVTARDAWMHRFPQRMELLPEVDEAVVGFIGVVAHGLGVEDGVAANRGVRNKNALRQQKMANYGVTSSATEPTRRSTS